MIVSKTQKVDGSTLYDSLELSFNIIDRTSILKLNNIDILASINLKALASYVYDKTDIDIVLNLKSHKINTYWKSDVEVCLSSLQAGIDRRLLIHAVDINGKFKINATTNDMLKTQRVDGSTLYDALELTFNTVDKTSTLKTNNIDILQPINNKAASNDVYNKHEVDLILSSLIGAAPAVLDTSVELAAALGNDQNYATTIQNQNVNKADKINTYLNCDVDVFLYSLQAGIHNRVLINAVDINCKFKLIAVSNDVLKVQRVDGSIVYDALELSYNYVDKASILKNIILVSYNLWIIML